MYTKMKIANLVKIHQRFDENSRDGFTIFINFATLQVEPFETLARFLLTVWQCFTRFAIFALFAFLDRSGILMF